MIDITQLDIQNILQASQGRERYIIYTQESDLGDRILEGVRCWQAHSKSRTCTHTPQCEWYDLILIYRGGATVIKQSELPFISVADMKQRILENAKEQEETWTAANSQEYQPPKN